MKDSVYICAGSICLCLIVCALCRMIAPVGATSKIMSVVISAFTLCCLFSPIVSLVKSIDVSAYEYEGQIKSKELSEEYDERVLKETSEYIGEYIYTMLKSADIDVQKVYAEISMDDNRGISVIAINIYLYEASDVQIKNIEDLIYSEFGLKPVILESKYGE